MGSNPTIPTNTMKIFILEDNHDRMAAISKLLAAVTTETGIDVGVPVRAETADSALEHLRAQDFDLLLLDHDLGGDPEKLAHNCGKTVARFLETNVLRTIKLIVVHSVNVEEATKMVAILSPHYPATHIPFTVLKTHIVDILKWVKEANETPSN